MRTTHRVSNVSPPSLCQRWQTLGMGLGLARLLLDAGRITEARITLADCQALYRAASMASSRPQPARS